MLWLQLWTNKVTGPAVHLLKMGLSACRQCIMSSDALSWSATVPSRSRIELQYPYPPHLFEHKTVCRARTPHRLPSRRTLGIFETMPARCY